MDILKHIANYFLKMSSKEEFWYIGSYLRLGYRVSTYPKFLGVPKNTGSRSRLLVRASLFYPLMRCVTQCLCALVSLVKMGIIIIFISLDFHEDQMS